MLSILLPSRDDIFSAFREHGYIEIDSPIGAYEAHECIMRFRQAIASLTPHVLNQTYTIFDKEQDIDLGFVDRSVKDGFDEKYYFHYHPFLETLGHFRDSLDYTRFLTSLRDIYRHMDEVAKDIFDIIAHGDEEILSLLYADPESRITNSNTRILQYRSKDDMDYLAKPHTDRGFLTLAFFETDPGLRMYAPDGGVIRSDYQEGRMKLFPGDLWQPVMGYRSPILGTRHDVIHMGTNEQRGSIVHFTNLARAVR